MTARPGWTPARVSGDEGEPLIDWLYTGDLDFTDPFFDQTIERAIRDPFTALFSYSAPLGGPLGRDSLEPGGFVFHLSRCGSTLLTQTLVAIGSVRVISEAPAIDAVLRSPATDEERIKRLRWVVEALGERRNGQRSYVLKLDAWSTLELPVVRAAFPDAPLVFLYRDPVEVLVSHLRRRGAHMVPGALPASLFGFPPRDLEEMPPEEHCARVLARISEEAVAAAERGDLVLVEYGELPEIVESMLLDVFGIEADEAERARLADAAVRDAKNPVVPFEPDSAAKQAAATREVRRAVEARLTPLYERLEQARLAQRAAAAC